MSPGDLEVGVGSGLLALPGYSQKKLRLGEWRAEFWVSALP